MSTIAEGNGRDSKLVQLEQLFSNLWEQYVTESPASLEIYNLFVQEGETVINDHIALRTFDDERVNIAKLGSFFEELGYQECGVYHFELKKLYAKHYEHKYDELQPKIFISQLLTEQFSPFVQETVKSVVDAIQLQKLSSSDLLFSGALWGELDYTIYQQLLAESEYAAWLYVFGFRANHFTILVNKLQKFNTIELVNQFVKGHGYTLNNSGGEIKGNPAELLEQSSTMANKVRVKFKQGTFEVLNSYYEFAKRYPMDNGKLYQGFIAASADKIFESTDINKKERAYNFGAGPAMLPTEVLLRAQEELLDWNGTGVSVMEIGHRTSNFQDMLARLKVKLRGLMNIPDNYKLLFLQGGAQGLFNLIPMNLLGKNKDVDYFVSGVWSERAAKYAKKYANVNIVTTASKDSIPDCSTWNLNKNAAYAYYCPNETINGIRFPSIPYTGDVPLIADMTSSILSEEVDISKFGLIFASAQKNLGIAGVTLVIVREDLLKADITNSITDSSVPDSSVPEVFNFKIQIEQNSCLNTPPTFAIYMMDLMADWSIKQGGVKKLELDTRAKSHKLYQYINQSHGFYTNPVALDYRSLINIPFSLADNDNQLLELFLSEAARHDLKYLKGSYIGWGARASFYNAMPLSGVDALIEFMHDFATKHG